MVEINIPLIVLRTEWSIIKQHTIVVRIPEMSFITLGKVGTVPI
jgi:hypothetical protein